MSDAIRGPALDEDQLDALVARVAQRLDLEPTIDGVLGSRTVRELREFLGEPDHALWLGVEELLTALVAAREEAGVASGYALGRAAVAAEARVGRVGDRDVALVGERVAAAVFASSLTADEAHEAAVAAIELLAADAEASEDEDHTTAADDGDDVP
jgi:hypothetical protein